MCLCRLFLLPRPTLLGSLSGFTSRAYTERPVGTMLLLLSRTQLLREGFFMSIAPSFSMFAPGLMGKRSMAKPLNLEATPQPAMTKVSGVHFQHLANVRKKHGSSSSGNSSSQMTRQGSQVLFGHGGVTGFSRTELLSASCSSCQKYLAVPLLLVILMRIAASQRDGITPLCAPSPSRLFAAGGVRGGQQLTPVRREARCGYLRPACAGEWPIIAISINPTHGVHLTYPCLQVSYRQHPFAVITFSWKASSTTCSRLGVMSKVAHVVTATTLCTGDNLSIDVYVSVLENTTGTPMVRS